MGQDVLREVRLSQVTYVPQIVQFRMLSCDARVFLPGLGACP